MKWKKVLFGWRWFFNGYMIGGLIGGWLIVQGLLEVQETWEKNKGPYILSSEWLDGPDKVSKSEYKREKYTQAGVLLFFGIVIWGFVAWAQEENKREAEKWERDPEDKGNYHHHLDTEFHTDEQFKRSLREARERDEREGLRNPIGTRRGTPASTGLNWRKALGTALPKDWKPKGWNDYYEAREREENKNGYVLDKLAELSGGRNLVRENWLWEGYAPPDYDLFWVNANGGVIPPTEAEKIEKVKEIVQQLQTRFDSEIESSS